MTSILFVDENNTIHSQIAECICKFLGNRTVTCASAGLHAKAINIEVAKVLNEMYGMDILKTQFSKKISELENEYDIVVLLNVDTEITSGHVEKWHLHETDFKLLVEELEMKIMMLLHEIKLGEII